MAKVKEPLPRYAHQVVYNPCTKAVFMHGGNAGLMGQQLERGREDESAKERRLDDFWHMSLIRFVLCCRQRRCYLFRFIDLVRRRSSGEQHTGYDANSKGQAFTISTILINLSGSVRCARKCPQ